MAGNISRASEESAPQSSVSNAAASDIEELTQSVKRIEILLATLVNERVNK